MLHGSSSMSSNRRKKRKARKKESSRHPLKRGFVLRTGKGKLGFDSGEGLDEDLRRTTAECFATSMTLGWLKPRGVSWRQLTALGIHLRAVQKQLSSWGMSGSRHSTSILSASDRGNAIGPHGVPHITTYYPI